MGHRHGAMSQRCGSVLSYRLRGWVLQAPTLPSPGHQGFLTLLIIFIFMTRLVNKTRKLAEHIYLSRLRSAKQHPVCVGGGGGGAGKALIN